MATYTLRNIGLIDDHLSSKVIEEDVVHEERNSDEQRPRLYALNAHSKSRIQFSVTPEY